MFDKSKVVLIGWLAGFTGLFDTVFPVRADPVPIPKEELMAPDPVRFNSHMHLDLVKPIPRDPRSPLPPRRSLTPTLQDPMSFMMMDLNRRLKENWQQHKGQHWQVDVQFRMHKDGSITEISLRKSSGNRDADEDAVRSVREVSHQIKVPPLYFDQEGAEIEVHFSDRLWDLPERPRDNSNPKSPNKTGGRVEI